MFTKLIELCKENRPKFGNKLLDYQNIDKDILICYLNIAMGSISNFRFKERMVYDKLTDAITVSEEAFGLVLFENNFNRWIYEGDMEVRKMNHETGNDDDSQVPVLLYQKNYRRRKDNKNSAGPWTEEGITRFNEFINTIRESRNSDWRSDFEDDIQQRYVNDADNSTSAFWRRKRKAEDEAEMNSRKVKPHNMFDAMTL